MEKVNLFIRTTKSKGSVKLRFRLRDTHVSDMYYKSEITASLSDLEKFNLDGSIKKGVYVYNKKLYKQIQDEIEIIREAYSRMKNEGLDLVSENLEIVIMRIKNPEMPQETESCLTDAVLQYTEERKKRYSDIRYKQFLVMYRQLVRFLTIKKKKTITPQQFTPKDILDFREFLFDEYQYVDKNPKIYDNLSEANIPRKKRSQTTVASTLKRLKACFQQWEDEELIPKSPFKKISSGDKRGLYKEQEGAKTGLTQSEIKAIKNTEVPKDLQEVKDAFLLQCYIGCRVQDYAHMTMDRVSETDDGIPYIHYLPRKEKSMGKTIDAPLVPSAMTIIDKYKFDFKILRNISGQKGYNKKIKELLKYCGIDRKIDDPQTDEYRPLYEMVCSKSARKTYMTLQVEHQPDPYVLGLHTPGSLSANNYITNSMNQKYKLVCIMFDEPLDLLKKVQKGA